MKILSNGVGALRKAGLVSPSEQTGGKKSLGSVLVGLVLLATCVFAALVFCGVL